MSAAATLAAASFDVANARRATVSISRVNL